MTYSQFINVMHGVYFLQGIGIPQGGRMTKCKIDVHLYPDNSGRNTGWDY